MRIGSLPLIAQIIATLIHPLWCYLFVVILKLNLSGLGIAITITQFSSLAIVTCYSFRIRKITDALIMPDSACFKKWGEYLKLGIPVMLLLWVEDFAFYVLTIISGLISIKAQATQIILVNISGQIFLIALGL